MPKRINRWRYDKQLVESLATTQSELDTAKTAVVQVGDILLLSNNTIRPGYLLCNGANVSRTTYAALFSVIGTTYGVGDGSTTFTLPNMNNRYPIGPGTNGLGAYIGEQLPNIVGALATRSHNSNSGPFGQTWLQDSIDGGWCQQGTVFYASSSNSIYNGSRVYPFSLVLNYVIKY